MSWKTRKQDKQTQRMFDNVTKSLLDQGNGLKRNPETGVLYEEFLKDEHPGLDLALMYAQPGSIVAKAFAPSMAKGLVEGIRNGDTEQAMLSMLVPEGNVAKILTKVTPKAGTTRLYRITGTSGKFTPSPDGTAEFAGQWFSNMPSKGLGYGSETVRKARLAKVDNPVELQVVDIPNSQLEHYRASNILKGRSDIEYEPKEDFLIPLSMPRQRVKINNLTGNRLKDASVKLPEIPELTEAERLGIPKGERSNPKALEDPQYWGYQQWNDRYNSAVEAGNWDEAQRLRDLHFKKKAPDTKVVDENGMPLHTYHGTTKHFTTFNNVNPKDIKFKTGGYHTADYDLANSVYGKGGYYNPANGKFFRKYGSVYDDYLNITNPFIDTPSHNISDIVGKLTRGNEYPNWGSLYGSGRVFIKNGGFDGVFVPRYHNTYLPTNSASQIKSAEPITWNGKGEIIPIVKRDNFRNLDRRYKQGGIVNPQQ